MCFTTLIRYIAVLPLVYLTARNLPTIATRIDVYVVGLATPSAPVRAAPVPYGLRFLI